GPNAVEATLDTSVSGRIELPFEDILHVARDLTCRIVEDEVRFALETCGSTSQAHLDVRLEARRRRAVQPLPEEHTAKLQRIAAVCAVTLTVGMRRPQHIGLVALEIERDLEPVRHDCLDLEQLAERHAPERRLRGPIAGRRVL